MTTITDINNLFNDAPSVVPSPKRKRSTKTKSSSGGRKTRRVRKRRVVRCDRCIRLKQACKPVGRKLTVPCDRCVKKFGVRDACGQCITAPLTPAKKTKTSPIKKKSVRPPSKKKPRVKQEDVPGCDSTTTSPDVDVFRVKSEPVKTEPVSGEITFDFGEASEDGDAPQDEPDVQPKVTIEPVVPRTDIVPESVMLACTEKPLEDRFYVQLSSPQSIDRLPSVGEIHKHILRITPKVRIPWRVTTHTVEVEAESPSLSYTLEYQRLNGTGGTKVRIVKDNEIHAQLSQYWAKYANQLPDHYSASTLYDTLWVPIRNDYLRTHAEEFLSESSPSSESTPETVSESDMTGFINNVCHNDYWNLWKRLLDVNNHHVQETNQLRNSIADLTVSVNKHNEEASDVRTTLARLDRSFRDSLTTQQQLSTCIMELTRSFTERFDQMDKELRTLRAGYFPCKEQARVVARNENKTRRMLQGANQEVQEVMRKGVSDEFAEPTSDQLKHVQLRGKAFQKSPRTRR